MRRGILLGVLLAIFVLSMTVAGFQAPQGQRRGGGAPEGQRRGGGAPEGQRRGAPPAPQPLEIQKVKDNLYMITGEGGNTAVFITDRAVTIVDTKNPGNGQAILDKIKTVTNKPVGTIINTHTHADHTGSNEFFGGPNVEFVAQINTKENMAKMPNFAGDKAKFLPSKTYKDKLKLGSGKDEIDLYYFGAAHTSGDSFVVFPALRAMHAGDAFAGKNTPIIDGNNGGSAVAYGKTLAKATDIKNIDTIMTGHSTLMTPADLKEYAAFNNDFITWVRGEIKAGKSVDAAAAEFKISDKYKGYTISTFLGGIKNNVQIAYNELGKK
jgi:glyoxylase-like metal-dependent hydrolase (beta-lactamase superfamily II)